jgi:hypothetical protein
MVLQEVVGLEFASTVLSTWSILYDYSSRQRIVLSVRGNHVDVHWTTTMLNGHSYPFGSQYHQQEDDHAFLSRHELLLLKLTGMDVMLM